MDLDAELNDDVPSEGSPGNIEIRKVEDKTEQKSEDWSFALISIVLLIILIFIIGILLIRKKRIPQPEEDESKKSSSPVYGELSHEMYYPPTSKEGELDQLSEE